MWILASASPRRKELLAEILPKFEIIPSLADESVTDNPTPKEFVEILAERKAREVASRPENEGKFVIGSDTVVAYGNEILGKPKD
ncbi:MAG: Maf family protein, partial [Clostridia bacterium]|nr:Maf family protein [Clostridia bacterium]